jgi:carboxyl-terminal processing protease
MRARSASAALAVAFALASSVTSAQPSTAFCDEWTRSDDAWPEVEAILRQNYAYLSRVADVDALLVSVGARAAEASTVAELGTIAEALGYAFRDGHFHVRPVAGPERAWIPSSSDFWVERDGNVWRIVDVRRNSAAFTQGLRPGWELIDMDGRPIAALAREALAPVQPEPDAAQLEYAVNVVTTGRLGAARSFTFRHAGSLREVLLPAAQQSIAPRPQSLLSVTDHEGIAQVRFHNSLGNNDVITAIDAALNEQISAKALIIDLRDTPSGGNTTVARAILGHFVAEPKVYQVHRNAYEEAALGVPRQYAEYVFPRGSRWERPVVVLAGRWTGSVGEALAMAFDRTAGVTTVGTPLADLLGTLNHNETRNGCLSLSFAWDSLSAADGTPREDWQPRILLDAGDTAGDGSDPALDSALLQSRGAGED